jgi:hypothetical protein
MLTSLKLMSARHSLTKPVIMRLINFSQNYYWSRLRSVLLTMNEIIVTLKVQPHNTKFVLPKSFLKVYNYNSLGTDLMIN